MTKVEINEVIEFQVTMSKLQYESIIRLYLSHVSSRNPKDGSLLEAFDSLGQIMLRAYNNKYHNIEACPRYTRVSKTNEVLFKERDDLV